MNNDPFFKLKHEGGVALPAVITTPEDGEVEIDVLFEKEQNDTLNVENINPAVMVQSRVIAGTTITNAGDIRGNTTIDIDELWEDDEGNPITDENDNVLYASSQYQYKVKKTHSDAEGITYIELTKD